MKFKVYSEQEIFEEFLLENKSHKELNNIFQYYSEIYLNMTEDELDSELAKSENSIIYLYYLRKGKRPPIAAKSFFDDFEKDETIAVNNPFAIYFLNKSEDELRELTQKYGLIFSNSNYSGYLHSNCKRRVLKKSKKIIKLEKIGWESLEIFSNQIFNSLVVTDRYLFATEKVKDSVTYPGMINLLGFLNLILPKDLKIPFHLTIVSEPLNNIRPEKVKERFKKLSKKIRKLHSDLEIQIELVLSKNLIHNRSAYANYFMFTLDNGFNVFSSNDYSTVSKDNKIELNYIFELNDPKDGDSFLEDFIKDIPSTKLSIRDSLDWVKEKGNSEYMAYGDVEPDYTIKNRLICCFP